MARELTEKQRRYAERRAAGESLAEAYNGAGYNPNGNRDTARHNADNLERRSAAAEAIQARIRELREAAERGAILKREERQALLTRIATDESERTRDRMTAIDQLNRMEGAYTDNLRTTIDGGVVLSYEERIAAIKDSLGATGNVHNGG